MAACFVKCARSRNTAGMVQKKNEHWLEQKAKVKEPLASEEYKTLMKKRSTKWGLLMIGYDFKQQVRLMNA